MSSYHDPSEHSDPAPVPEADQPGEPGGVTAHAEAVLALLATVDTPDELLRDAVPLVLDALPACTSVALAVVRDGSPLSVAASDTAAHLATEVQYRQGSGPCLTATGTGRVTEVIVAEAADHEEWGVITGATGATHTLAVPIPAADDDLAGALVLNSTGPWSPGDVATATLLAAATGRALTTAVRIEREQDAEPTPA